MVEPLITSNSSNENDNSDMSGNSSKSTEFMANSFAKILGKKKFKKLAVQEFDGEIVQVVRDVYRVPEERKDEMGSWILDKDENFLVHAAYKHRTENIILICYRGTDFKNMKDLFSDIQIVLGVNSIDSRVQNSLDFYDEIQMKYPDCKKWVCGHSLGGTISYIVTKHRVPERCVVFNPGASPTKSFIGMMKDTLFGKDRTKCITTYKIWGDTISTLSFVGNVKSFTVKSVNPLTLHTINSFPQLFEEEKFGYE